MRFDALLANRDVTVTHTGVFGCSTKWQETSASRIEAQQTAQRVGQGAAR
jgi:hypothetical protein